MASNIPAGLKAADIAKFATRASQLQTVKPVVAYWCEMRMLNQIISKGLHTTDSECLQYTTNLMDKLEQTKADNSNNDAIVDNAAGQAYVEQFALEVFQRAENAIQANKVTKQTAETFQAAAIFLEVLKEWGELDPEIQAKIKYAKWNTLRIVKAIKEGKDPNESNPKPEPAPEENLPALDPNDPDVLKLGGEEQAQSRQPTVEDAPDETDQVQSHLAAQSANDQSLHPSGQPSPVISPASGSKFDPYPKDGFPYNIATTNNDVSPPDPSPNPRNGSVGGGYFPSVPTFMTDTGAPALPTAPPEDQIDLESTPDLPDSSRLPPPGHGNTEDFSSFPPPDIKDDEIQPPSPQNFYRQDPPARQYIPPSHPQQPFNPPPPQQQFNYPSQPHQYQAPPPQIPTAMPPPVVPARQQVLNTDEEAIAKAQKHARWAISALNFEDVETAVKELRAALVTLGAQ